ncbi:HECT-domain-containing protein [Ramaria rubella]|nr:HECT-domain-containing protein [Ramaria rubella]
MLPFTTQESIARRNINLGGTTTQSSQSAILDRARNLRNARRDERKKEDAALKIQKWLISQREMQALRADLRIQFDLGPFHGDSSVWDGDMDQHYIHWTRLLLLSGVDAERLSRWSNELSKENRLLLGPFNGPFKESWLVLIRQIALLLLQSASRDLGHNQAKCYLQIIATLLSPSAWACTLPETSPTFHTNAMVDVATYLVRKNMFVYLAQALKQVVPSSKSVTNASVSISQIIYSTFVIFSATSPATMSSCSSVSVSHAKCIALLQFVTHVLAVPILPNRIPLTELPQLVSRIPWADFPLIYFSLICGDIIPPTTVIALVATIEKSSRPHVLANLLAFLPPRYAKLPPESLAAYLELYTTLMDSVKPGQLVAPATSLSIPKQAAIDSDSGSEDEAAMDVDVQGPSQVTQTEPAVSLDTRTLSRLTVLTTPAHLSSLLVATSHSSMAREQFFRFVLRLTVTIPNKRDHIWTMLSISSSGGSGLVRECWRGYVRSSHLGKVEGEGAAKALMDPLYATAWPPLLFLISLYTHSLLTIGDDEFFSLSSSSTTTPRNPLTIDDLIVFSRQLLHIAFPLYCFDDQAKVKEKGPSGVGFTWEKVRELVSGCLKGIHARDSRRSFTPPGHWLITSQLDLHSFVEAAVIEEQELSSTEAVPTTTPFARHRRSGLSPRQLAHISPRLGILNNIPFAIPFEVRVEIFRHFVRNDYERTFSRTSGLGPMGMMGVRAALDAFDRPRRKRAAVRRGNISQDGFDQLSSLGAELKGPVEIQFIDQFGQEEAGIDGGGVFKEFLTSLSKEVFDTNRGLWLATPQQELYPNPHSYATEPHQLNWYRFIGRILGKALYEGILVDVAFASFFLAKWLGKQSYLDDLASLDAELYNGLIFLKHYNKNFEDLSLNFTISEDDFGISRTVNLVPNGEQISVTKENRLQYIYLVSHYRLSRQIKLQSEAFFEGLSDIIDPKWLRMFNQQEVQILVGGVNAPIDLDDLRQNCTYGGLYDDNEETIRLFWKVANSFDHEQRRGLLRFVTSCARPPLLGFKELYPKFSIRDSSSDEQRLPTSSTCVNLLKLPRYQSERVMREKLLQAINSGAGFDLS